ncbi:MAG: hypothetical protein HC831_22320 [Chloroflexia bacterium]|nr:hypothetical protein [Chloroflexia bacterium]
MVKYIFLFFFVSFSLAFSQKGFQRGEDRKPEFNLHKAVFIEPHAIPFDSLYKCYFTYKIPFNNILFLKDGENFTGGISLKLEVHKGDAYLKSETVSKKITVTNYDLTNSDNDFLEGLLTIYLNEGNYTIKPLLNIENLNKDILIPPFPLEIKITEPANIFDPIVNL